MDMLVAFEPLDRWLLLDMVVLYEVDSWRMEACSEKELAMGIL